MKLLVTRPAEDAAYLAAELRARGHEVLIAPMMTVSRRPERMPPLDGIAGLLFTSANGVRAFVKASPRRDLPAYAVGDHTAAIARESGFATVETAGGDGAALVRLVIAKRQPADGKLLHVASSDRAGDVAGGLRAAGFTVDLALLYEAVPIEDFAPNVLEALAGGWLDGVLLFSPRTAKLFTNLVCSKGVAKSTKRLTAWCLSPAVASAISGLPVADKRIAAEPTQAAMLKLLGPADLPADAVEPPPPKEETAMAATSRTDTTKPAAAPPPSPGLPPHAPGQATRKVDLQAKRRRKAGFAAGAVVIILVGLATSPFWAPSLGDFLPWGPAPPPPPPPVETAAAPPPPDLAPPPPPGPAPGAIASPDRFAPPAPAAGSDSADLQALRKRVATLEARPAAAAQGDIQAALLDQRKLAVAVSDLSDKLGKLQDQVRAIDRAAASDKALVLAMGEVHMALAGSGPFEAPLAVVSALAADDKAMQAPLAVLRRHAQSGLPGDALLRARLDDVAEALAVAPPAASDAPWWQRTLVPVMRLVKVSRVPENGDATALPAGPERSVALARAALDAGDLPGAVTSMRDLAHADAVSQRWLADAQARLDAESAARQIDSALTQRMAAAGGSAP